jgi:hypothetical protein
MQSKKEAWIEQFVRVGIGFITNYPINLIILGAFGLETSGKSSMGVVSLYITLVFTVWALIRGYAVRRFFDYLAQRKVNKNHAQCKGYETNKDYIQNQVGFVTAKLK